MTINRRHVLAGLAAAPIAASLARPARAATTLKISHQFPGGTLEQGDFRDRLCRKFAAEVEKRTNGALEVRNLSELVVDEDERAVLGGPQRCARLSLYPLAYAGGELPAANIGLMPCLVTSYEQGAGVEKCRSRAGVDQAPRR